MPVLEEFSGSVSRLAVGELASVAALPVVLTRAAVEVLGVSGASLSLMSETVRMPLGADSPTSTTAEQLQFTLGEGPCLDVYRTRQVHFYDADAMAGRWPMYGGELARRTPYRSCSSSPIDLGDTLHAALDLYSTSPDISADAAPTDVAIVVDQIERELRLHATRANADAGPQWLRSDTMRRRANVWIALALAATTSNLPGSDALTVMRAYAFGADLTIDELARRLAERELDIRTVLAPPPG